MDNRSQRGKSSRGGRPAGSTPAPGGASSPDDKASSTASNAYPYSPGSNRGGGGQDREGSEFKEKVIQIRRVTKVVKGGKKLSFRAVVVVGNGAGQVGIGIGKSHEVIGAIQKGVAEAMKNLIEVPLLRQSDSGVATIPHPAQAKAGGAVVMIRQASAGTGVIAGGAARAVIELAGISNILSKSLGSNSPLNVAWATLKALSELRTFRSVAQNRGMTVREMLT